MEKRRTAVKGTIYDDVFRTMMDKMPSLIIPLVNEVFSVHYAEGERVTALQNEHMELGEHKVITDSYLCIRDRCHHIECQSWPDGTMSVRMLEYDFLIALKHVKREGKEYILEYPNSCVLYLRYRKETPDYLTAHIHYPDGTTCDYRTPVVKVNQYGMDEIFEKKLLFFLPFYIIRYEDRLKQIEDDEKKLSDLLDEYRRLYEKLYSLKARQQISNYEFTELKRLILKIVNWIAWNEEKIRKGVECMGGKVLEFEHDILMRESEARGKILGQKLGEAERTVMLIDALSRNSGVGLSKACRLAGIRIADYRNAKKVLSDLEAADRKKVH